MSSGEGSPALVSLKNSMQVVRKDRDRYKELYVETIQKLEKETSRKEELKAEAEVLREKIQHMDGDFQQLSEKLAEVSAKLDETTKLADECERARRALDHRKNMDEDRIAILEQMIKDAIDATTESDRKFEEVSRKLLIVEADKDRVDVKTEGTELKAKGVEEEIHILTSKLKGLEGQFEEFAEREEKYERTIGELRARIKNSETHSSDADELVGKLEGELNHLKDELKQSKTQYQSLREELDPFAREIPAM